MNLEAVRAEIARRKSSASPLEQVRQEIARRQAQTNEAPTISQDLAQQAIDRGDEFTSRVGQFGAGTKEGIASMLGFPVDAVSSALNATGLTDTDSPLGGSDSIQSMFDSFVPNAADPQNRTERILRRTGEEVGASAAGLPLMLGSASAKALPSLLASEGASSVGSGVAAGGAAELASDSLVAEIIAQLLGGVASGRAVKSGTPAEIRSGSDELRQIANDAYGRVEANPVPTEQTSLDRFSEGLNETMRRADMDPDLNPIPTASTNLVTKRIAEGEVGDVLDLEKMRRKAMRNLPVTASPEDKALSMTLRNEITDYIDQVGGQNAEDLRIGRNATRRRKAAEDVQLAQELGSRRAASTGSGGNEINATRQRLRGLIESPKRRMSFKDDEVKAIDEIVRGTSKQNMLRRVSRFSPSSGGLAAMLNLGGAAAAPQVAIPFMAATELAKAAGESSTLSSIDNLMQSLAPDRVITPADSSVRDMVRSMLMLRQGAATAE